MMIGHTMLAQQRRARLYRAARDYTIILLGAWGLVATVANLIAWVLE